MKVTKHIMFGAIFAVGMTFTSCGVDDNTKDVLPRLNVDKSIVQVIQDGKLKSGSPATINITSNKGYSITSDSEWLSVDRPEGQGRVTVEIVAEPNESGAERTGHLKISSLNISEIVTVNQNLELNLDDKLEIGHVYFYDDFHWAIDGSDAVAIKAAGDQRNIYTYTAWTGDDPLPVFKANYEDFNSNAKTVYTQDGYLKFNKTNTLTAISPKVNGVESGKTSAVRVSFRAAFQDKSTKIAVGVIGQGQIKDSEQIEGGCVSPQLITPDATWKWYDVSVDIAGLAGEDKVVVGPIEFIRDNVTSSGTFRWFLDDLKIEKIAN